MPAALVLCFCGRKTDDRSDFNASTKPNSGMHLSINWQNADEHLKFYKSCDFNSLLGWG